MKRKQKLLLAKLAELDQVGEKLKAQETVTPADERTTCSLSLNGHHSGMRTTRNDKQARLHKVEQTERWES